MGGGGGGRGTSLGEWEHKTTTPRPDEHMYCFQKQSYLSYYHQYSHICSGSYDISRHAICVKYNMC